MSAETLRKAAALMRERAEGATQGPWETFATRQVTGVTTERQRLTYIQKHTSGAAPERNAAHIASWHPVVALAVAEWLENEAQAVDELSVSLSDYPIGVARAYLGEPS